MKIILMLLTLSGACLLLPHPANADQITHTIRCESEEFSPRRCDLPVAPRGSEIKEIRKSRQLSTKPCIEGKSWVADESGITVSRGCRADFIVVYRFDDRSDRHRGWRGHRDSDGYNEDSDNRDRGYSPEPQDDATEIIVRSFEDILNRRPKREEMHFYRRLIEDRGWTERQIRRDLREKYHSGNRF